MRATTSEMLLERRAAQPRGQQLVDLEDPRRVVHGDLDPHGPLLAGLDLDLVDRRCGQRVDVGPARLERHARAALGQVECVGHAQDPSLEGQRLAAAAVGDDGVQRLRGDDRALGLLVDIRQQLRQGVGGQEEAVLLVVGAVDRHAGVVQKAGAGDHHLGVVRAHGVVADHRRRDPAPLEQPEQAQGDVEDDLDVDPRVVGHAESGRDQLLSAPPGLEPLVGVGGLEQPLEPPVAAGRRPARGCRPARRANEEGRPGPAGKGLRPRRGATLPGEGGPTARSFGRARWAAALR
jgi:hypothetical protein